MNHHKTNAKGCAFLIYRLYNVYQSVCFIQFFSCFNVSLYQRRPTLTFSHVPLNNFRYNHNYIYNGVKNFFFITDFQKKKKKKE